MSEEATTTTTDTGETAAATAATFTQEQVSAIAAKEAKAARAKAQSDLLSNLGVDSADDLKAALDGFRQFQDSQKSAEQKAAELASQVDTYKSQATSALATVQAILDAEVSAIPEDKRGIVPDFGDAAKTLAWIAGNRALFGSGEAAAAVVNIGSGASPGAHPQTSNVSLDEFSKMKPNERVKFYTDYPEQAAQYSTDLRNSVLS